MIKPKTSGSPEKSVHMVSTSMRKENNVLRFLLPVIVVLSLLLIWFFISYLKLFPAYALPSPGSVLKSFRQELLATRLINDVIASLWRVAVGFVLSAVLGIPAGFNNQKVILKNQKTLDSILKNQQKILKLLRKK